MKEVKTLTVKYQNGEEEIFTSSDYNFTGYIASHLNGELPERMTFNAKDGSRVTLNINAVSKVTVEYK